MTSVPRVVKEFVESHPWVIVSLFAGIFIGLTIALPLGWELPEPGGSLLAATSGAAVAVGGAIWAAKYKQDAEISEHKGQRDEETKHLRQAVARALHADVDAAIENLSGLNESLAHYDVVAEYLRDHVAFGAAITDMRAFDRLVQLLPRLGEPLASSLIHVDVEMLRINAELEGLHAGKIEFRETFKNDVREVLRDLETAKNLLTPHITIAFVGRAGQSMGRGGHLNV